MTALSRVSGEWGALLARRPKVALASVAAALVFAAVLCAGVHRARLATSVGEQWVLQGSRLTRDRETYQRLFGGLSRDMTLVVSSASSAGPRAAVSAAATGATKEGTSATLDSALSVRAFRALLNATRALLSNSSSIAVEVSAGSPVTLRAADICARSAVPVVFGPTSGAGFGIDRTVLSWGYAFLSKCLANSSLLPPGVNHLPDSWGIASFPCQRTSALDCFRDGGFDYPPELRAIDESGLARAMADSARKNSTAHKKCVRELEVMYTPLARITYPQDPERGKSEARVLANAVDQFIIPTFATWGYAHRPRIADFEGDDEALRRYVTAGITNLRNPNITPEQCVRDGIPCCRLWNGLALDPAVAIGGTKFSGTNASDAVAIRTALVVDNEKSPSLASRLPSESTAAKETDARLDLLLDFEKSFVNYFRPAHERDSGSGFGPDGDFKGLHLDFFATRSSDDILRDGNQAPAKLIIIGYSLMLLYTALALANFSRPFGPHNLVLSRVGLGVCGLLVLSLGTVCGFGFVSWLDISLSPTTTNVLPFIAHSGSVQNSVASGSMEGQPAECLPADGSGNVPDGVESTAVQDIVEVRMRMAFSSVGPSIILTSLSLFIGFLVASAVRIPAVYTFAYQLAATILINLILLFLLFMPVCAADSYRVAQQRMDFFPCCESKLGVAESEVKGGTIGAAVSRFARDCLGPKVLFRSPLGASVVLVGAVLFTIGMTVLGLLKSKPGLPLNTVALQGTYQRSFLDVQEKHFPVFGSYLVHAAREGAKEGAFLSRDVQTGMVLQADAVQVAEGTSSTPAIHQVAWLHNASSSFLGTYNELAGISKLSTPIPTKDAYRESFGTFAAINGASYLGDLYCEGRENNITSSSSSSSSRAVDDLSSAVACDLRGGYPGEIVRDVEIRGSRMPFLQSGLQDTEAIVAAIRSSRSAVDSAQTSASMGENIEFFVYGAVYEFYEQYVSIYRNLVKVVGFALLGVTLVVFALLQSFRLTVAIVLVMLLIILQTFGLCTALGVQLNAVSVTSYVVAIAMSVEFTAHYAHAYSEIAFRDCAGLGQGGERKLRAQGALNRMLAPNVNGFASTAVSLVALYGSRFPFVRLYYALSWMLLAGVAFLNGVVVLPCLLWLFGPNQRRTEEIRETDSREG